MSQPNTSSDLISDTLLAQARLGNDAALEALIRHCEPRIYALARAILKEPAWAEDVTQDTLLRMLQKLSEVDAAADDFDKWLLRIARNHAISLLRKRRVRGELGEFDSEQPLDDSSELSGGEQLAPSDLMVALEDAGRLTAAVGRLPAASREIVVLRFYHDLEPQEIGTVIGQSAVNVRVRLYRAIRELRTLLQEKDEQT